MRIYATRDDNGRRVLVALKCDGCGAEVKPHQALADSGWVKEGAGTNAWEWCPDCARCRNNTSFRGSMSYGIDTFGTLERPCKPRKGK